MSDTLYVRGSPGVHEVEGGWTLFGGVLLLVFGLIFGSIGAFGVYIRAQVVRAGNALRDRGQVRQATVTGSEDANVTVNGQKLWRILWRDDVGTMGKSMAHRSDMLPATGSQITIYADPESRLPPACGRATAARGRVPKSQRGQAGPTKASVTPCASLICTVKTPPGTSSGPCST